MAKVRDKPILIAYLAIYLFAIWLVLVVIKFTAPPDLMGHDQQRPAAYVLDCVRNANWWSQRDATGDVMSKPPLYTWLAALTTLAVGRISRFSLYLPCALAVLGTAGILFHFGRKYFSLGAGFWAALAYLTAMTSFKQLALARTDPVFVFTIVLAAYFLFEAWQRGRGWPLFWLAAAAATLTKGPLGVVLAAGGLFAIVWERYASAPSLHNESIVAGNGPATAWFARSYRRSIERPRRVFLNWSQITGILLYCLVVGGWLVAAILVDGRDFIDKVLLRELVGQAVSNKHPEFFVSFFKPTLYFLVRFLPWSFLACYGLWRTWKSPSNDPAARRLERFLSCYLVAGLFLFTVAAHKRPDLNFPLLPVAALLAGRETARLLRPRRLARYATGVTAYVVFFCLVGGIYAHTMRPQASSVQQTIAIRAFAQKIEERLGTEFPLTYAEGAPYGLQFYLNTMRPNVSNAEAGTLLQSPDAAFVVFRGDVDPRKQLEIDTIDLFEVAVCETREETVLRIFGNRPVLENTGRMGMILSGIRVHMEGVEIIRADERALRFHAVQPHGQVRLQNRSRESRYPHIVITGAESKIEDTPTLRSGESITYTY